MRLGSLVAFEFTVLKFEATLYSRSKEIERRVQEKRQDLRGKGRLVKAQGKVDGRGSELSRHVAIVVT